MNPSGDAGRLILACEFAARHPGTFLPSQFAIAQAARARIGLETVFVFPERVSEKAFGCPRWPKPDSLSKSSPSTNPR
jgi:hypothetical protein